MKTSAILIWVLFLIHTTSTAHSMTCGGPQPPTDCSSAKGSLDRCFRAAQNGITDQYGAPITQSECHRCIDPYIQKFCGGSGGGSFNDTMLQNLLSEKYSQYEKDCGKAPSVSTDFSNPNAAMWGNITGAAGSQRYIDCVDNAKAKARREVQEAAQAQEAKEACARGSSGQSNGLQVEMAGLWDDNAGCYAYNITVSNISGKPLYAEVWPQSRNVINKLASGKVRIESNQQTLMGYIQNPGSGNWEPGVSWQSYPIETAAPKQKEEAPPAEEKPVKKKSMLDEITDMQKEVDEQILSHAAEGNEAGVVEDIKKGANVNARNSHQETPLHGAVSNDQYGTAVTLINSGADTNAKNIYGTTSLHVAASKGNTNMTELLLKSGAEINAQDSTGKTALIYAVSQNFPQTMSFLVNRGADVNIKDNVSWTAFDYAMNMENRRWLKGHGAKSGIKIAFDFKYGALAALLGLGLLYKRIRTKTAASLQSENKDKNIENTFEC